MPRRIRDPLSTARCCGRRLQATWRPDGGGIWKCRSCQAVGGQRLTQPIDNRRIVAPRARELVARRGGQAPAMGVLAAKQSDAPPPRRPSEGAGAGARRPRSLELADVFLAAETAADKGFL